MVKNGHIHVRLSMDDPVKETSEPQQLLLLKGLYIHQLKCVCMTYNIIPATNYYICMDKIVYPLLSTLDIRAAAWRQSTSYWSAW